MNIPNVKVKYETWEIVLALVLVRKSKKDINAWELL